MKKVYFAFCLHFKIFCLPVVFISSQQRRELEAVNLQLHAARAQLTALGLDQNVRHGCSAMDSLEDSIVQLLRKMNIPSSDMNAASHRGTSALTYRDKQVWHALYNSNYSQN